jgi:hypothetical protein
VSKKIPTGTTVELSDALTNATRRNVLRGISGVALGSLGLSGLVEKATGKTPDGKVLTLTTDLEGNPDMVRVVPQERYRRLKLYEKMPAQQLIGRHPSLTAISITQQSSDPSDLALEFILDPEVEKGRGQLPTTYRDVPISRKEKALSQQPQDYSGGLECNAPNEETGTTTVVVYDNSSGDKVILTAEHVTNSDQDLYIGGGKAGSHRSTDQSVDAVSYALDDPSFGTVGKVKDIQNITGAWTFSGLADTVGQTDDGDSVGDGGTVGVDLYGDKSGHVSDVCNNTKRTGNVDYQADMKHARTKKGDSGAPWVDDSGKFLALHSGVEDYYKTTYWSYGAVGQPVFDSLGVSLSQ